MMETASDKSNTQKVLKISGKKLLMVYNLLPVGWMLATSQNPHFNIKGSSPNFASHIK